MTPAAMPPALPNLLAQAANESEDATARLFAAATMRAELDEWLPALAQDARDQGHTWADLGMALGVTKQAMQKRFGGERKAWVYDTTRDGPELRPPTPEEAAKWSENGERRPASARPWNLPT